MTTTTTYDPRHALSWAAAQIGTAEQPPHSNHVPYWPMWQKLTGCTYAGQGDAWCGCFAWLALHRGGYTAPANYVSVAAIEDDARRRGLWGEVGAAQLGDLAVIGGRGVHVVFVVARQAGGIVCIGGNTGDAVRRVFYNDHDVYGIARLSQLADPHHHAHATAPHDEPAPPPNRHHEHPSPHVPAQRPAEHPHAVELPTLREGARGAAVRAVQHLTGASPDGDYGAQTATCVRNAQAAAWPHHRDRWDGIVGPATWRLLLLGEHDR